MSMETFESLVEKISKKMNLLAEPEIGYDEYKKRYYANVGGIWFFANPISMKISCNWGDHHTAMLDPQMVEAACA